MKKPPDGVNATVRGPFFQSVLFSQYFQSILFRISRYNFPFVWFDCPFR